MTDVTITGPAATATITTPVGEVITQSRGTFLKLMDSQGIRIEEVHFESVFPGEMPWQQIFTIGNYGTGSTDILIDTRASETNQQGLDLETYLSTFLSLDGIIYTPSLEFSIGANATQEFYVKYQPPSTATPGEKQWKLHVEIPETEETPTVSNNFLVTSTHTEPLTNVEATIIIPYVADVMRPDFGDIRFFNGTTELGYYIWSKTDGVSATFVMRIPYLPGSATPLEITVYAGNPDATTTSNPLDVYLFFDDFQGDTINTTKWPNGSGASVSDGILTLTNGTLTFAGTWTPPFGLELGIHEYIGQTDWRAMGINHAGQSWDPAYWLGYYVSNGTHYLQSNGCTSVTRELTYPTVLEMRMESKDVYKNYHNGELYQEATGRNYSTPLTLYLYAGWYRNSTMKLDYVIIHHLQTHVPEVGSLKLWEQVKIDAEIKAGLIYKSKYLPGITPEVKHGLKIGNYFYD
ncbi:DUF2341 domain-containing protein [Methanobacterium sp.]|uniref:DUF2341 domain-containing protein n=1 Tax=Methanobacterium sp. TaxID=2164 RepID=UPI002ABB621B|nr:DUF2341 domain-containing protein [Methanobacterium sp.]MDY9922801.1 DUF2341 domain-containing protein [Methanobacterium sp.]